MSSLYRALCALADRFAAMPDDAKKVALAQDIFGYDGAQLIPLLNNGSRAIDEMIRRDSADELQAAKAEIERLQQERRWIPCSERTPERGEYVEVTCLPGRYISEGRYQRRGWVSPCDIRLDVIAWRHMPLDKPYEGP